MCWSPGSCGGIRPSRYDRTHRCAWSARRGWATGTRGRARTDRTDRTDRTERRVGPCSRYRHVGWGDRGYRTFRCHRQYSHLLRHRLGREYGHEYIDSDDHGKCSGRRGRVELWCNCRATQLLLHLHRGSDRHHPIAACVELLGDSIRIVTADPSLQFLLRGDWSDGWAVPCSSSDLLSRSLRTSAHGAMTAGFQSHASVLISAVRG